jgi:hypothetical protein
MLRGDFADRTVSYKLRQREDLGWSDSWSDPARRTGWERKLTPAEHRVKPNPIPGVEWEYEITDALIRALERRLMRPLRFSRRPSGGTYGDPPEKSARTRRQRAAERRCRQSPDGAAPNYDRSSSSAFAALRSAVAKPSVNRS